MGNGWAYSGNPVDMAFFFVMGISVALLVGIVGVMLYFAVRYSRERQPEAVEIKESVVLEIVWTVIPTILVLAIFWVGLKGFLYMRNPPPGALPVKVIARQWSWKFIYPNGKEDSVLRVPLGKPVNLLMRSADVLHSLYIPAYRIKEDCLPNLETHLWFLPDELGSYDLFCSEFCGVAHSAMITKVEVMPRKEFDAWYQGENKPAPAGPEGKAGKKKAPAGPDAARLVDGKGCTACHSLDGTAGIGPTFKGLYGSRQVVLRGEAEAEVTADAAFLRMKILDPEKERVKDFPPVMPSQEGLLTDNEIDAIIEYLKTLK